MSYDRSSAVYRSPSDGKYYAFLYFTDDINATNLAHFWAVTIPLDTIRTLLKSVK